MSAPLRLLAIASLMASSTQAAARTETLYVAMGGSYPIAGAQQPGDAARLALRLREAGQPVRLVDLTVAGSTALSVRKSQLPRAIALRPRLVTLAIGPAEIAEDIPLRTFSRDLQVITDLLRRNGATVAISTLPPAEWIREAPSSAFRRRLDAFDWTIRRNAQRNGALLVDIGSEELASPTSWVDAVFAALGNPALPGRSAPRDRAPERPEAIGDALVPPRSAADERLVAAQSMPVASGPCGARA